MGGYRDEYEEDLDEYEDEEADGERYEDDGCEEEEDPQPSKEVQDYLVLRQRLKEEKREQLKKELGTGNSSSREKKNSILKSKDNYGSFFGSSQPVIAQRVIQESKSLLENPHLLDKAMKSKDVVTKNTVSASVSSKSQAMVQTPKVTNGVHKKVQMIKNIRDYSFLESDGSPPHEPVKDHQQKVYAPKSEAHMAQLSERNRDFSSTNGRKTPSSNRDDKKSAPVNGQMRPKVGGHRQTPSDTRKQLPVSNGTTSHDRKQVPNKIGSSGPGRPMVSKNVPSKYLGGGSADNKRISMPAAAKSSTSHVQRPALSKPPHPVSKQPHLSSKRQPPVSKQQPPISKQQSFGRREQHEQSRKPNLLPKQAAYEEMRRQNNALPKQVSHEELRKPKILPRNGAPVLKPKVTQPPPRSSARPMVADDRNRKRPMRPRDDDDDDPDNAINMIRNMFKYNPSKYRDVDDDDRSMVTDFRQIEMEEKRSARIARQEDEEELRKIEEEERRERMRKESKKRKLH